MSFNGEVPGMGIPYIFFLLTLPLFLLLLVIVWKTPEDEKNELTSNIKEGD